MFDKVKQHKNDVFIVALLSFFVCVCVLSLFPTNLHTLPHENLLIKFYCFYLFNTKIVFCLFAVSQLMSMSHYSMRFLPCIPSIGWIFLYHCTGSEPTSQQITMMWFTSILPRFFFDSFHWTLFSAQNVDFSHFFVKAILQVALKPIYTYSNNSKMLATHLSTEWWR